jgi:hypothetical protein
MTSPKTLQLIALAEEMSNKMDKTVILDNKINPNIAFEAQREFARQFKRKLRALIGELSGDLFTLKERQFDANMWRLAVKVKDELEKIWMEIKENNPHMMGWKFVDYVMDKPNRDIIDNLDFLAHHHLENTQPEAMKPLPIAMKHTEVNSFKHLKEFAQETKDYMEKNPPLSIPGSGPPPPREPNPMADPSFLAPPDVSTKV